MLLRNEVKVKHSYHFKGTYYFRKVIRYKHIVNEPKNKDYMLRISLKKLLGNLYYVLEKNNIELYKLTTYLNTRLSIYLRHRGQMEINDILDYIYVLAEDYKKNAVIENTALEVRRIEALEYYDENGYHAGHTIQALSKKYKEIITQYDRLTIDTQKIIKLGQEIVKRSNITKE